MSDLREDLLREKALQLAVGGAQDFVGDTAVERAKKYYNFLRGDTEKQHVVSDEDKQPYRPGL